MIIIIIIIKINHYLVYEKDGEFFKIIKEGERIPFVGDIRGIFDLRPSIHTLNIDPVTTSDGANVSCSIKFTKKVIDPVKATYSIQNIESAIFDIIDSHAKELIHNYKYYELVDKKDTLIEKIKEITVKPISD